MSAFTQRTSLGKPKTVRSSGIATKSWAYANETKAPGMASWTVAIHVPPSTGEPEAPMRRTRPSGPADVTPGYPKRLGFWRFWLRISPPGNGTL